MNQYPDDTNWREEMKAFTSNKRELELLENGPDSLSASWRLMALKNQWLKIKGYVAPEPVDCQSSFKEVNEKIKELEKRVDCMEEFIPGFHD